MLRKILLFACVLVLANVSVTLAKGGGKIKPVGVAKDEVALTPSQQAVVSKVIGVISHSEATPGKGVMCTFSARDKTLKVILVDKEDTVRLGFLYHVEADEDNPKNRIAKCCGVKISGSRSQLAAILVAFEKSWKLDKTTPEESTFYTSGSDYLISYRYRALGGPALTIESYSTNDTDTELQLSSLVK